MRDKWQLQAQVKNTVDMAASLCASCLLAGVETLWSMQIPPPHLDEVNRPQHQITSTNQHPISMATK